MKPPRQSIVPLSGGIDQATSVIRRRQGTAIDLINFEPRLGGGYRRINGTERVDGRPAPSDALLYALSVADSSGISVGASITGVTSGATANVIAKDDASNTLGITNLSGNFQALESVAGTTVSSAEILNGVDVPATEDLWQLAAENYYRDLIGALPGTGNAVYAFRYAGTYYGFRESGGTLLLYKSTASGWTQVDYYHVLFYDAGTMAAALNEGDTLTGATSGASGEIKRFIKNAGSYGSTASGYIIIDVASGTFQNNENLQVSAVTVAVADGANTAVTMATGGTFSHVHHNFYGSSATQRVYGCDGINPAWEFDGDVLTPIYMSGSEPDPEFNKPTYLEAHKTHLFLGFETGQVAHSTPGEPLVFSGLLGSAEFGLGDQLTGMASRAGSVLALYTRNKTFGLFGTSAADWELRLISETSGAIARTVGVVGSVYSLDDKGIVPLDRVESYGDFESATVSRAIRPLIEAYKDRVVGSSIRRESNQYRLYIDNGDVIVMVFDSFVGERYPAFSMLRLPIAPTFVSHSDDTSGSEYVLIGDSSGFVYRADTGYNFDGEDMEFAFRSQFLHQDSPNVRKGYHKLYADIDADRSFSISIAFETGYGDSTAAANNAITKSFVGGGGFYDVDNWDEIFWDAESFSSGGARLSGHGKNIGVLFHGKSKTVRPFTIETLEVQYFPRRINRAE